MMVLQQSVEGFETFFFLVTLFVSSGYVIAFI